MMHWADNGPRDNACTRTHTYTYTYTYTYTHVHKYAQRHTNTTSRKYIFISTTSGFSVILSQTQGKVNPLGLWKGQAGALIGPLLCEEVGHPPSPWGSLCLGAGFMCSQTWFSFLYSSFSLIDGTFSLCTAFS